MSASCVGRRVRDDRAVAVDQHPVGQAHEEHAGDDRRRPGAVLMISNAGPDGVRRGVRRAGDHAVGEPEVHHHGAEVRRRR